MKRLIAIIPVIAILLVGQAFAQENGAGLSVEIDREVERSTDTSRDVPLADTEKTALKRGDNGNGGDPLYVAEPEAFMGEFEGVVTRVLDADLIEINGERIYLLGVNAPEYQRSNNDCFALEATKKLEAMVLDKTVTYSFDRKYSRRDRHGDTRVYIYINGDLVNAELIKGGFAFVDPSKRYHMRDEFIEYQKEASHKHKGLWHACPVECDRNGICRTRNW